MQQAGQGIDVVCAILATNADQNSMITFYKRWAAILENMSANSFLRLK